MRKAKWVLSSPDVPNSLTGEPGDSATVYNRKDLRRRQSAAKKAGIKTSVRKIKD